MARRTSVSEQVQPETTTKSKKWEPWKPEPRATATLGPQTMTVESVTILSRLNQPDVIATGLNEKTTTDRKTGEKIVGIYDLLIEKGMISTIEPLEELFSYGYIENAPDAELNGNVNKRKWRLSPSGMAMAQQADQWLKDNAARIEKHAAKVLGE